MKPQLTGVFGFSIRQVALATIMGSIAMSIRNMGLYAEIYPPFKLDPRWIFSLLGTCWTGPFGGLICGFLAAMKLPYPLIDLAAIPVHFIIGLISRLLMKIQRKYLYACFLWPVLGVPAYWMATWLFMPQKATLTLIPVLAFIGISSSAITFVVGLAVEKRAKKLLSFILK